MYRFRLWVGLPSCCLRGHDPTTRFRVKGVGFKGFVRDLARSVEGAQSVYSACIPRMSFEHPCGELPKLRGTLCGGSPLKMKP